MKSKLLTAVVVLPALLAILWTSCRPSEQTNKATYKVGAILSLTGRGAKYGKAAQQGLAIALDEVNRRGGVGKIPVELFIEDSMSEAKSAISAYQKLVETHHVNAVIGPILSDEVLAVAPEANRKKILIIAPAAGSDDIARAGPYVFRNRESANLQSVEIAKYLLGQPGEQRIAIVYSTTANAISYKDSFLAELGGQRQRVVLQESFAEGQTDFRTVIAKLKNANVTHVFVPGLAPEIARILVQAREVGFEAKWLSTAGAFDPELLKVAGPAAEGLIFGAPDLSTKNPESRTALFDKQLKERFGSSVDMFSANSYDALLMVTMAANGASGKQDQLPGSLLAIKQFPGAGGITTFVSPGTVLKPITLMTVNGGRFVQHSVGATP